MHRVDFQDLIGGILLILMGTATAVYAYASYELGTVRQMGPGMVPTALGCLLVIFGLLILGPAFTRRRPMPRADMRPFLAVCAGIALFAVGARYFGLVPAVVMLTGAAVLGDRKVGIPGFLILAVVLSIISVVVFIYGLGIQINAFRWPF